MCYCYDSTLLQANRMIRQGLGHSENATVLESSRLQYVRLVVQGLTVEWSNEVSSNVGERSLNNHVQSIDVMDNCQRGAIEEAARGQGLLHVTAKSPLTMSHYQPVLRPRLRSASSSDYLSFQETSKKNVISPDHPSNTDRKRTLQSEGLPTLNALHCLSTSALPSKPSSEAFLHTARDFKSLPRTNSASTLMTNVCPTPHISNVTVIFPLPTKDPLIIQKQLFGYTSCFHLRKSDRGDSIESNITRERGRELSSPQSGPHSRSKDDDDHIENR